MMEKLQGLRIKIWAAKHGYPSRSLKLIVVAGPYGKTTTIQFLEAILRESGKRVVSLTDRSEPTFDRSIDHFFKLLAEAKKQRAEYVIIEQTKKLEKSGILSEVLIESFVMTGDTAGINKLLHSQPKHVVSPTEYVVPAGSVEPYQHITFGEDEQADAKIDRMRFLKNGSELSLTIDHQTKLELATYAVGKANAIDLAISVATAYVLGVNLGAVQEGIAEMLPVEGHFTRYKLPGEITVYIDVAQSEKSIQYALESIMALKSRRVIVAINTELAESTLDTSKHSVDRVFAVSSAAQSSGIVDVVSNSKEALDKAVRAAKVGDIILCIGSTFTDRIEEMK